MKLDLKNFKKNNYDKHIVLGSYIGFVISWLGSLLFNMDDFGWIVKGIVVGIFGVGALAYNWEHYNGRVKGAPFSIPDIIISVIAGILGSYIQELTGNSFIALGLFTALNIYWFKFKK